MPLWNFFLNLETIAWGIETATVKRFLKHFCNVKTLLQLVHDNSVFFLQLKWQKELRRWNAHTVCIPTKYQNKWKIMNAKRKWYTENFSMPSWPTNWSNQCHEMSWIFGQFMMNPPKCCNDIILKQKVFKLRKFSHHMKFSHFPTVSYNEVITQIFGLKRNIPGRVEK